MTFVSVVIPCHNCEQWVERAVKSVLCQSYPIAEILLIENNSTDNTLKLLKQLEKKHRGLIRVYSQDIRGACAARNFGLAKANGDWIQFLDADDEILRDKIARQIVTASETNSDVIIGDYTRIGQLQNKKYYANIIAEDDPWLGLIESRIGITSANLWRKESIVKVNGFDEKLNSSQEYDLMFRLLKSKCNFVVVHHKDTLIHKQSESISKTKDTNKTALIFLSRYKLRIEIMKYLQQQGLLTEIYKQKLLQHLYYILLSIKELNLPLFKEQIKYVKFDELIFTHKLKAYIDSISHSPKRRYAKSNFLLRNTERNFYAIKHILSLKL